MDIGPGELMVILAIVLVLFGGKKIPEIARGLGQAQREFRRGLEDGNDEQPIARSGAAVQAPPSDGA
ncbi:MAG: Sec-independent protein translocase subunit TatA/TatB [Acidimicrobiales bacterium]